MTLFTAFESLLVLLVLMTGVWVVSLLRRNVSVIDIFWSIGFLAVAWLNWLSVETHSIRQVVVMGCLHLWALRLALYLLWRWWGAPEDKRYQAMRIRNGPRFAITSLVSVFWLQAALAAVISLPVQMVLRAVEPFELGLLDAIGGVLFVVGFGFEAIGDAQMVQFKADRSNQGKVCDRGLWRYTRHPNYFGEAVLWWGLWCFAAAIPTGGWTVVAPIVMTLLLLRVSGVSLLERQLVEEKLSYRQYMARTSAFIPWPPKPGSAAEDEVTHSF